MEVAYFLLFAAAFIDACQCFVAVLVGVDVDALVADWAGLLQQSKTIP
jgi:TRAP-type uncharacterized transport system fused permease subunit